MSRNERARALTEMAACPRTPGAQKAEVDARDERRMLTSGVTDILTISANPTLAVCLSGLFRPPPWRVHRSLRLADAIEFLQENRAAVAVWEQDICEAGWPDAAALLHAVPHPPMLVMIGDSGTMLDEVVALGGFDVLTRPLRESEVIWTVASAWHEWMKRFECQDRETRR